MCCCLLRLVIIEMCKERNGEMPKIDDWLTLRDDKDGLYTTFMTLFIPCVIGVLPYKNQVGVKFITSFVTVCDEAFALLILENCEDKWMEMFQNNVTKSGTANKYTDGGNSKKNGRSRSFSGWSNAGLNRFNVLFDMVRADRNIEDCSFEGDFRNKMSEKYGRKRKRVVLPRSDDAEVPCDYVMDEMEIVPV